MSDQEIKKEIEQYLTDPKHFYLNLATVTPEGAPLAHTMAFAAQGATVFFATRQDTRKAANIKANPQVAYVVDQDDYPSFMDIKGVQMEGRAAIITDPQEIAQVGKLYTAKFGGGMDFPPSEMHIVIKVEPVRAYFLNYSKGFAHKDLVEY